MAHDRAYEVDHATSEEAPHAAYEADEAPRNSAPTDRPYVENWLSQHSFAHDGGDIDTRTSDAFDIPGVYADAAPASDVMTSVNHLIDKKPTKTRGPDGYAAWLLEAITLGFVASEIMPKAQLGDLKAGRPVRTYEFWREVNEKRENQRKQQTGGKLDNAHRVPDKKWEWDIETAETPILETVVAVARARLIAWRNGGGGKAHTIMSLAQFVRADMWFTPPDPKDAPIHETGTAIDLGFIGTPNSESYVLQLLGDLPPQGTITLFRDTDDALHLDRRPGGYGLGVPAKGDFLPAEYAIDENTQRCPAQKIAEQNAGGATTIHAKGIKLFGAGVVQSTATLVNGAWHWADWVSTGDSVLPYLHSARVRDAINAFGHKSAKPSP